MQPYDVSRYHDCVSLVSWSSMMCNTCKPRVEVKSKTLNSLRQTRSVYLHALRAFYMCKQFDLDCDFANDFYVCIARQGLSHI